MLVLLQKSSQICTRFVVDVFFFNLLTVRGTLKMRDMKLWDMKMRHQNAKVENARHEFSAPDCRGGICET